MKTLSIILMLIVVASTMSFINAIIENDIVTVLFTSLVSLVCSVGVGIISPSNN